MFRKPLFWVLFVLFSLGCALFGYLYFPKAFPLVTVDVNMDRQGALQQAGQLAEEHDWGPEDYRQASTYNLDRQVQYYVELEAGGVEAFQQMLDGDLYEPYTWRVRHFQQQEANETRIRFTPDGRPYGFQETLPEEEPGPQLSSDSARSIAEREAVQSWDVDLQPYQLVETSEELQPGDRLDHSFVYQRLDEQIGEADYRLRLTVSGDRLTELVHFVRVPEGFDRRYAEMRSANQTLSDSAFIAASVLFFIGGCVIGLFFLIRQRRVVWRTPLIWGVVVAFLGALVSINSWPLTWMNYDTALTIQSFVLQQAVGILIQFAGMALIFSLIFIAAESMARKAFPNHVQLWKVWKGDVAATPHVLGLTAAAFLLTGIDIAYVTGTYFLTSEVFGWWTPSDALFSPDILAQYLPWLSAIAMPLQAAFWEEALFRAIPIAGAVLLGRRYGGTVYWVVAAIILQAFIFGAAHANYAQQPFYARTLELIIPSLIFAGLFYYFGLLPAILLHFWYNMVWFSMPVFAAGTAGVWLDQLLIILVGLTPFWIVLFHWWRQGGWGAVPQEYWNRSWQPQPEEQPSEAETREEAEPEAGVPAPVRRYVPLAGVVGLVLLFGDVTRDAPPVETTRSGAIEVADRELERRGVVLGDEWQPVSRVIGSAGNPDRFIWQEGGEEVYASLMGEYLAPPLWMVRYITYAGDVEERAEEHRVYITGRDSVYRYRHMLPEHRPGARLEESRARLLADSSVHATYGLNPGELRFISAESSSRPERTDWSIIYADSTHYPLDRGEARIEITVAGDRVVDERRYVHVPEAWERQYREDRTFASIVEGLSGLVIVLVILSGVIYGLVGWTRRHAFSNRTFLLTGGLYFGLSLLGYLLGWQSAISGFSTAQPFINQAATNAAFSVVGLLVVSGVAGVLGGLAQRWQPPVAREPAGRVALLGVSAGVFLTGVVIASGSLLPANEPNWGQIGSADASIPVLQSMVSSLQNYIFAVVVLLVLFNAVNHLTGGWTRPKKLYGGMLFLLGFPVAGLYVPDTALQWLVASAGIGLALTGSYILLFRYQLHALLYTVAAGLILLQAELVVNPAFPGAVIAFFGIAVLLGLVAWLGHRLLASGEAH